MRLPRHLRDQLKTPLGTLVPDSHVNKDVVSAQIAGAARVITVGDRTTERLIGFDIVPDLQIVDGHERRVMRDPPRLPGGSIRECCTNPPGEITEESIDKIQHALSSDSPVRLVVRGEEDLLVIPACTYAPLGSVVLYGQPSKGMVVVRVDWETRRKTQTLLDSMGNGDDETVAV